MRRFTIYQIKDIENCDYAFRDLDESKFSITDYKKVYDNQIEFQGRDEEMLEFLFMLSNIGKINYVGHTLSISDVVNIEGKYYYCGDSGWYEVSV